MIHESVKLLEERCFAAPNFIRNLPVEPLVHAARILHDGEIIFVTGIGASEGPARLFASCLANRYRTARFIPLSGLLAGDHRSWIENGIASRLVIFSQALSPNAKMALEAGRDFVTTILVCGPDVEVEEPVHGRKPIVVLRHPPIGETGFLLRATGPAVASAFALVLATMALEDDVPKGLSEQLHQCAEAMGKRLHGPVPDIDFLAQPPAFLVYGQDGVERNHLLRWTLLECLDKYDPSSWDLLSFAHGAFQNIFDDARTLILPRSTADKAMEPLVARLRDMLGQTKHILLDMPSELPRPWCVLEHLAMVQALVLGHLRKYPRDLANWPGKGCDGAIYGLSALPP